MANVTHSTRTDPDLHEPKGVDTASVGTVYQADGAGSGSWQRPITLLASGENVTTTAVDVMGLGAYNEIIVVCEALNVGENKNFGVQLYSTSAGDWRTNTGSGGYLNAYIRENSDGVTAFGGLLLGSTFGSGRQYLTGVLRISSFNHSSIKTTATSQCSAVDAFYPLTATTPTNQVGLVTSSRYDTAEAHEGIRIRANGGTSYSNFYYAVWGIK